MNETNGVLVFTYEILMHVLNLIQLIKNPPIKSHDIEHKQISDINQGHNYAEN